jgi:hypothetical protein
VEPFQSRYEPDYISRIGQPAPEGCAADPDKPYLRHRAAHDAAQSIAVASLMNVANWHQAAMRVVVGDVAVEGEADVRRTHRPFVLMTLSRL